MLLSKKSDKLWNLNTSFERNVVSNLTAVVNIRQNKHEWRRSKNTNAKGTIKL